METQTELTQTIKSYDVPNFDGMSTDEVKSVRSKVMADAAGDPKHPYNFGGHPQCKEMRAAITNSYNITAGIPETTKKCHEALEWGKQNKLSGIKKLKFDIDAEIAKQKELGHNPERGMPDSPRPYHLDCIRLQTMLIEKDYIKLVSAMRRELIILKAPPEIEQKYWDFVKIEDEDFKSISAKNLVEWIYAKHQKREEQFKTKKKEVDKRPNYRKKLDMEKTLRSL